MKSFKPTESTATQTDSIPNLINTNARPVSKINIQNIMFPLSVNMLVLIQYHSGTKAPLWNPSK